MSTQSLTEIGQFLIPIQLNPLSVEWLPLFFFLVIWGLFYLTIWHVRKNATPEKWENNWRGGNKNDRSGDLDAEHGSVMEISDAVATPAEKWADIMPGMILIIGLLGTFLSLGLALDKASLILTQVDGSSMDSSMSNLMGMMQGLGTKFKTSTWALLAFITLKIILSRNGYDEQRLRWSIRKVKTELDNVREKKINEESERSYQLISSIQLVAAQFEKTLLGNHQDQKTLLTTLGQQNQELIETIQGNHDESLKSLQESARQNLATRKAMEQFVQTNAATVETLGQSAAGMSHAAKEMGGSANQLKEVINSFRDNMEEVVTMMKDDLGSTIKDMNTSFSKNMGKMSDDLAKNISDMNVNFKKNMGEMSQGLGTATTDISDAVRSLSTNVEKTMDNVSNTISDSMDIQKKAYQAFVETSDHLNGQVIEMTQLVEKLSGDITAGLKAVSESNRNVISLNKRYDSNSDQVLAVLAKFEAVNDSIKKLANFDPVLERFVYTVQTQHALLETIANNTAKGSNFPFSSKKNKTLSIGNVNER